MAAATDLLELLVQEEALLEAHEYAAAAALTARKEDLTAAVIVEGGAPETLSEIISRAGRNAETLNLALSALKGLKARFAELERADAAVGYSETGARLSHDDGRGKVRV